MIIFTPPYILFRLYFVFCTHLGKIISAIFLLPVT